MIQCPVITSRRLVDAGLIVEVLPQFTAAPMPVSRLYPHRRRIAPRVKAIMNWIAEVLEPHLVEIVKGTSNNSNFVIPVLRLRSGQADLRSGRNPAILNTNAVLSVHCTVSLISWAPAFAGVTNF
jgi:hypothetical protein